MRLNFLDAFSFPFRSESLSFLTFADRAVALSTILSIVFVALFAVHLLRIHVAHGIRIFHRAFRAGDRLKMLWVYTVTIAASVVSEQIARRPIGYVKSHPVGFPVGSTEEKYSVPIVVNLSLPQSAISLLDPLFVKATQLLRGNVRHSFELQIKQTLIGDYMVRTVNGRAAL